MSADSDSTGTTATAAVLTPRGRGAVATIRVRAENGAFDWNRETLFRAANDRRLAEQEIGRVLFGRWGKNPAEEVVVCRRDAQTVEIHCHGGDAAARRILGDLHAAGCQAVSWIEQHTAGHGLLDTECREALSRATTLRTADILLDQASGTLRRAFESLRGPPPSITEDEPVAAWASRAIAQLDALLAWADFGLHLALPWQVVLTGRPNVGKSSLINALLGYARSIVCDQPGTTRDVVTAETAFQGWPVELADTAGIRAAGGEVEAAGIARARAHLAQADLRIVVLDVSRPADAEDLALLREWPDALIVAHKVDLSEAWGVPLPANVVEVSSRTGMGVDELANRMLEKLVPRVPEPGTATPLSTRQVELLRQARAAAREGDRETWSRAVGQLPS
jgi:tRNA modification GTPase